MSSTSIEPRWDSADVCRFGKFSRPTLMRLVKANRFPQPIRVGRQLRWNPDTIRNFFAESQDVGDENE